jgi:hypothetical protein
MKMHNLATVIALCFVFLALSSHTCFATIVVEYLSPLDEWPTDFAPINADCIMGNTDDPGYILPAEAFSRLFNSYTFNPNLFDCNCDAGFQVEAYHFIVAKTGTASSQLYIDLSLGDSYLLPDFPPGPECSRPSNGTGYSFGRYCHGDNGYTNLTDSGFYKITLTNISACDCVYTSYAHSFTFFLFGAEDIFLVTNVDPGHCPDFTGDPSMGSIWWDEIDAPGNMSIWADVNCCLDPVGTEECNWERVKAFYK